MYSSEKNPGMNWKDIIIKAIFLVVFVLLLMWLFPKVPNMKPFYSNVFRENIKYMQDAAESYYTDERLPKNIGDTSEMTLQEMINKNIILPFVDQDGNDCDTSASYVQVKKNKDDYTLKVNLVCPTEKNYVEKTLGCYTYCEECEQAKETLEYQFKKPVTSNKTTYSCPKGGELKDGTCYIYKTNSYKATETTEKGQLYCPKGGELRNDGKCYVTDISSYPASMSIGGDYCLNGTKPVNGICYSTTSRPNIYNASVRSYTCPNGTVQNSPICTTTTQGTKYIKNYTCPNGTVQSSATCTVAGTAKTKTNTIKTTATKGSGYTLISSGYEYTCSNHALCPKRVYYNTYSYKTTTYTCPKGYSGSKTCTAQGTPNYVTTAGNTTTVQGTPNYYCLNGETPTRDGKCYGTTLTLDSYLAYKDTNTKYCPKGGNITSDGKCTINNSYSYLASKTDGTTVLTCPNGGELKDKSCYTTVVESSYKAEAKNKKVTSYQYKWSTEEKLDGWTPTGQTRKVTENK